MEGAQADACIDEGDVNPPHHSEPNSFTTTTTEATTTAEEDFLAPSYTFLEKVKMEFVNQPNVFDQFLHIMKSFESNQLDTIGVVDEVVKLFQGKDALLAQFATFLPQGHQILTQHPTDPTSTTTSEYVLVVPTNIAQGAGEEEENSTAVQLGPPPVSPKPSGMNQALEFVRRVRLRSQACGNGLAGFDAFLDMLTGIQTQPMSFIEIVKEVSNLFRDHNDLLRDFPMFLPVEVREAACREIEEIIARRKRLQTVKERRGHTTAKQASASFSKRSNSVTSAPAAAATAASAYVPPPIPYSSTSASASTSSSSSIKPFASKRLIKPESPIPEMQSKHPAVAPPRLLSLPLPRVESHLFHRIKMYFSQSRGGKWHELLTCLQMVEAGLLTRFELITLGQDWFAEAPQLWEEFDRFLAARGFTESPQEDAWFSVPVTDVDFDVADAREEELHAMGWNISYHVLPKLYPSASSSNASKLLNSTLIAVPSHLNPNRAPVAVTATTAATAVSHLRNACEDKLIKCEDDQYEMSLLIDCNQSAIEFFEVVMDQQPEDVFAKLSVMHLKAISRVYGEDCGLMFESLKKNPMATVSVILARLKQKDAEWKLENVRQENAVWKEVLKENLSKSQDYQSGIFKQADKKLPKSYLAELKEPTFTAELNFDHYFVHRYAMQLVGYVHDDQQQQQHNSAAALLESIASHIIPFFSSAPMLAEASVGQEVLTCKGLATVLELVGSDRVVVKLECDGEVVEMERCNLAKYVVREQRDDTACVSGDGYLFLRVYHLLCDRLVMLEALCNAHAMQVKDFLADTVKPFIESTLPATQFEEQCFAVFGNKAYFCYTLDKLAQQIVKLLQQMVNEDKAMRMVEISKRFQPDSIASCVEFRRSTVDALQFPRNCPCSAVLVKRSGVQSTKLVLEASHHVPGAFNERDLVMEFFEPLQIPNTEQNKMMMMTVSIFFSAVYSANAAAFTSKQNSLVLKTLTNDWWNACLTSHDSIVFNKGRFVDGGLATDMSEEEEVVPTRKRRKMVEE